MIYIYIYEKKVIGEMNDIKNRCGQQNNKHNQWIWIQILQIDSAHQGMDLPFNNNNNNNHKILLIMFSI